MENIKKEFERLGWECSGDEGEFTIRSGNITGKVFVIPMESVEVFSEYILSKKNKIKEAVPNETVAILATDFCFEVYINGEYQGTMSLSISPQTVNMYLQEDEEREVI